jgi:SPP1 family predicted phage head-tail adaptor
MKIGSQITNPGELRTQITLQTRSVTTSPGGFQVPAWTNLATVWSRWTNAHGSEVWTAESIGAESPATVLIRYRAGVDTTCAVLKGSDRYEIVSVDNIHERSEYLELKVRRMEAG